MTRAIEANALVGGGRYRLERLIGKGGMGVVWLAEEVATGRHYALKLITAPDDAARDYRKRLVREARAATAVVHPNVVKIHEVIEDEGGEVLLVMEHLVGFTLRARLDASAPLSVGETLEVMLPVLGAVAAAHRAGVVHRDLKPENIFLVSGEGGRFDVRVLDFGIAKVMDPDNEGLNVTTTGLTVTGSVIGTPAYMSPEQACGEKDLDVRSDVWSLGVIFFECLTNEHPIRGENIGQIIKSIVSGNVTRLARTCPSLPKPVSEAVDQCLHVEKRDRPADLDVMAKKLAPYADCDVRLDAFEVPPSGPRDPGFDLAPTEVMPSAARASRRPPIIDSEEATSPRIGVGQTSPDTLLDPPARRMKLAVVGAVLAIFLGAFVVSSKLGRPDAGGASAGPSGAAGNTPPRATVSVTAPAVDVPEPNATSVASNAPAAPVATATDAATPALSSASPSAPSSARPPRGPRVTAASSPTSTPTTDAGRTNGPAVLQGGVAGEAPF